MHKLITVDSCSLYVNLRYYVHTCGRCGRLGGTFGGYLFGLLQQEMVNCNFFVLFGSRILPSQLREMFAVEFPAKLNAGHGYS
jgi:hypothetical protein